MQIRQGLEHVPDKLARCFRKLGQLEPRICPFVLTLTEDGEKVATAAFTILWDEVLFLVDFLCADGLDRTKVLQVFLRHASDLVRSTPRVMYAGFLSSSLEDWRCLNDFTREDIWPRPGGEGRLPPLIAMFSAHLGKLVFARMVRNSVSVFQGEMGLSRAGADAAPIHDEKLLRWWSDACGRPVFCIGKIPLK